MNKILAITTATEGVNNLTSKILDYTLKYNINQIDDFIIITDYQSPEIEAICQKYNVKFIKTAKFYENGAPFDKGKAISQVLKNISSGWVLHLDCDILLPKNFKEEINKINLVLNKLYGARRIMFSNLEMVKKWFHENKNPEDLSDHIPYGYCWGYFQLFNMDSPQIKMSDIENIYPSNGTVYEGDGWFRNKWGLMIEKYYQKGKILPDPEDVIVKGNIEELPFFVGHLGNKESTGQDFQLN